MKNAFLFSALAVAALAMTGCDKGGDEMPRLAFTKEFVVENKTDREITVSFDPESYKGTGSNGHGYTGYTEWWNGFAVSSSYDYNPYGYYNGSEDEIVTLKIAPGESTMVFFEGWVEATGHRGNLLDFIEPGKSMPYGDDTGTANYVYPYAMTVGGEAVASAIWMREQWSYLLTTNHSGSVYTLSVTDELLARLAAPTPGSGQPSPTPQQ